MSENQPGQSPDSTMHGAGFEPEGTLAPNSEFEDTKKAAKKKPSKATELKQNFQSVFGHGVGKAALISVGVFLVIAVGVAVRGMTKGPKEEDQRAAKVDMPNTPRPRVTVDPIDSKEAERRNQRAALEAQAAERRGDSYQPDFNPAVVKNQGASAGGLTQPQLGLVEGAAPPVPPASAASQPVNVTVPAGTQSANAGAGANTAAQQANAQAQQEDQRRKQEHDRQQQVVNKYIEDVQKGVKDQVEDMVGSSQKPGSLRGVGTYATVTYLPSQRATGTSGAAGGVTGSAGAPAGSASAPAKKAVFRAGRAAFATMDAEANTDDGMEAFATMRGGPYDKAKLIGKIEQGPRNIRLHFTKLAPDDDRPTLSINAYAIREEDARLGVADEIDNHTLERYTALFAGSVLQGLGKAAAQPQGQVIVLPNGQTIVQQDELSNKRIAMYALGEVGTNAGQEIRKSFSTPPTYKKFAGKGIGVIFLDDVFEK